jgi:hypothetical protein
MLSDRPGVADVLVWTLAVARPLALVLLAVMAVRARQRWRARRAPLPYAPAPAPRDEARPERPTG